MKGIAMKKLETKNINEDIVVGPPISRTLSFQSGIVKKKVKVSDKFIPFLFTIFQIILFNYN